MQSIIELEPVMIQTPVTPQRYDRLTAFLQAFGLSARSCRKDEDQTSANLLVIGSPDAHPTHILFRCRGRRPSPAGTAEAKGEAEAGLCIAAAHVDFGGALNPLIGALPDEICFPLETSVQMRTLAELFIAEHDVPRCGGATVRDRLCEVIVILAVRQAIANGTVTGGLLAGLVHPSLCPCLVALHDTPAHPWTVDSLAQISGLSRSHFSTLFTHVVGVPPAAYLTSWRLALAHSLLGRDSSIKAVAAQVGFGSQEAFSRAFSRHYGCPPSAVRQVARH